MNIKQIALSELKFYENNVKEHPQKQIDAIAKSIKSFGFRQPIVIDKNKVIIAGHARCESAKILGLVHVPCELVDDLSQEEIDAYRILDNEIAKQGTTNIEALNLEIQKLPNFDFEPFNLEIPTFEKLNEGLCDDDEIPPLKVDVISKPGDIWILGDHFLMCGDSTNPQHVEELCKDFSPKLMVTDPPYGVNYDPKWREDAGKRIGPTSQGKVENDNKVDWTDAYSLFPGDIVYLWHAGKYTGDIATHINNCGFEIVSQIIWVKQHFALSRGDYHWQHEPCWYSVRKGQKHNWQGARDQSTTWQIANNNSFGNSSVEETFGHGTQKPLECMVRPIRNNSKEGDYVYDPFGGSGTTLIACEKTNRKCLMMEISPQYCDVIVSRWEKFTGKKAKLSNG